MTLAQGTIIAAATWLTVVLVICIAWRRDVWIGSFYEENGHHSTRWWAWPHNTGLPLGSPES